MWITDGGNEFFSADGSILELIGANHVGYLPPVHQYLFPNDNNHHSAAKAIWRSLRLDYDDDVTASVALLKCLDNDSVNITGYFEANMQCKSSVLDIECVRKLIA